MKNNKTVSYLLSVGILIVVFVTIYGVFQQVLRQGANDPQIQVAGDVVNLIASGVKIEDVTRQIESIQKVNVDVSIAPFVGIYDTAGKVLASTGVLRGKPYSVPLGVFTSIPVSGESRITLEPEKGLRIASDIRKFDGGYVVAGKSLSEVDHRIRSIGFMVLIGWVVSLAVLSIKKYIS